MSQTKIILKAENHKKFRILMYYKILCGLVLLPHTYSVIFSYSELSMVMFALTQNTEGPIVFYLSKNG